MLYTVVRQKIGVQSNILCCDLSSSFIAAYDDSHCLQLFHPVSLSLLQKLPIEFAKKAHLSLISVSPDEQLILCATAAGVVAVIKAGSGDVLCRVCEHSGQAISCAVWEATAGEKDKSSTLVYVGDTSGVVTLINVPTTKVSALFRTVCTRLLKLSSSITQLDFLDGHLLVSTLSASFICNTRKEVFTKVGEKPQSGKFGGCLLRVWPSLNDSAAPSPLSVTSTAQHYPNNRSDSSCCTITDVFVPDDLSTLIQFDENYACVLYSYYCKEPSLPSNSYLKTSLASENSERKWSSSTDQPKNGLWRAHGHRSLRSEVRCFSGRPKARVWESDISGRVLRTHSLADVLSLPPLVVYDSEMDGLIVQNFSEKSGASLDGIVTNGIINIDGEKEHMDMSPLKAPSMKELHSSTVDKSMSVISFSQISNFQNKFLLLVCNTGLYCYDPVTCSITFNLKIHVDARVKTCGNNLLVHSEGTFMKLTVMSPEVGILALHSLHLLKSCSHLALQHMDLFEHSAVLCRVRNLVVRDILSVLTDTNDRQKFEELLARLTQAQERRPFDDLFPNQDKAIKLTCSPAVLLGKSSSEQNSPVKSISSCDQDSFEAIAEKELDTPFPLLRPRPVLGMSCGKILYPSSYLPSSHTVFQDLVESVASNVSSSSLLSAFSSKVTAAAKRSFDSVTTNVNDGLPHQDSLKNPSDHKLDCLLNGNVNLRDDDAHLMEDNRALENSGNREGDNWMEHSVSLSRPASDSRDGTPNSCEDLREVRSETDDLVVFRSVRRKKKTRKGPRRKTGSKNFSPSTNDIEKPVMSTSSSEEHGDVLQDLIKELDAKTTSCKREVHSASDSCVLVTWLSEFIQCLIAVSSLASNGRDCTYTDQVSGLTHFSKLMKNQLNLKRNLSHLLVLCLNKKLLVDAAPPRNAPKLNIVVNYHFLTSSHERNLDDFYATLFTSASCIIDEELIINNSPVPALFSFVKTWHVLLSSVSEECAAVIVAQPPPMIDILPALDFTRYQRLTVLIRALTQDGVSGLVKAAAKLRHSSAVFEMLMVLRPHTEYLSCSQSSRQYCCDPLDVLYLYLIEVCLCSQTLAKYVQVWSCSRQMQYDLIHSILKNRKHLLRSCLCGFALPVGLPRDGVSSLLCTAVTGPLYDPSEVYKLCQTLGYWRGCASLFLLHELGEVSECIPLVLQSCSAESLALLFQAVQPSHVTEILSLLSGMSDGVQPHEVKCHQCCSVSAIHGGSAKPEDSATTDDLKTVQAGNVTMSFDELTASEHGSDCVLPLPEVWARCVEAAVGLVGGAAVLQLLEALVCRAHILPGVIPICVYRSLVAATATPPHAAGLLRRSWLAGVRGRSDLPFLERRRILRSAREKWTNDSNVCTVSAATSSHSAPAAGRTASARDAHGSLEPGCPKGSEQDACATSHKLTTVNQTLMDDHELATSNRDDFLCTTIGCAPTVNESAAKNIDTAAVNQIRTGAAQIYKASSASFIEQDLPTSAPLKNVLPNELPAMGPSMFLVPDSCNECKLLRSAVQPFATRVPRPISGDHALSADCLQSEPLYGIYLQAEGSNCVSCKLPLSLPSLLAPGQASSASLQNQLQARACLHGDIRSVARSRSVHTVHYSNIDLLYSAIVRVLEDRILNNTCLFCCCARRDAANVPLGDSASATKGSGVCRSWNSSAHPENGALGMNTCTSGQRCGHMRDDTQRVPFGKNYSWLSSSNARVTGIRIQLCSHASHAACLYSRDV